MALSDPISITIGGSAKSFVRISTEGRKSVYRTADGEWKLVVSHQENNKVRSLVQIVHRTTATDPTDSSLTVPVESTMNFTYTHDVMFPAEVTKLIDAFVGTSAWLTASTNAQLTKVVNGES